MRVVVHHFANAHAVILGQFEHGVALSDLDMGAECGADHQHRPVYFPPAPLQVKNNLLRSADVWVVLNHRELFQQQGRRMGDVYQGPLEQGQSVQD